MADIQGLVIKSNEIPEIDMNHANRVNIYNSVGKRLVGLSKSQEIFAKMVAQYPEELVHSQTDKDGRMRRNKLGLNLQLLCSLYANIPPVVDNPSKKYQSVILAWKNPSFQSRLELYRKVYNTDKHDLLIEREEITSEVRERWEKDKKAKVRTSDLLTAFKDRELAYGLGKERQDVQVVLSNGRAQEALKIVTDAHKEVLGTGERVVYSKPDSPSDPNSLIQDIYEDD